MDIIEKVRAALISHSNAKVVETSARFFKEGEAAKVYGVKGADMHHIANLFAMTINKLPKNEVWKLCDELWKSDYFEEHIIACDWIYSLRNQFEIEDFFQFEKWISHNVSNWADCDTFCNHSVGAFLEKFPDFLPQLKVWAISKNRIVRRAAAVSLIVPARKGVFLEAIFEISEMLLTDEEDLVQKGYGWLLKTAGNKHQDKVFQFVMKHKNAMPRTALRYAIEKMPSELKQLAMQK